MAGAREQRRSRIMAKTEYHTEQTETTTPSGLMPSAFIAIGRQHIHECVKAHSELVDRLREMNRSWLDHVQSEAELTAEFASKMTAARSVPYVATLLLEWNKRHIEMAKVDARHVLADARKIMEVGARLSPGGWLFNGSGRGSSISVAAAGFPSPASPSSAARPDYSASPTAPF